MAAGKRRARGGSPSGERRCDEKPKTDERKTPSAARRTSRRLWLFRAVAAIAAPALVVLGLEAGLRIAGCGFPSTATIGCRVDGVACRGDNVKFGWRFFHRKIAQEFDPFVFPEDKPEGTYRIFVLGASAAQGNPDSAYGFGRIMAVLLADARPDTHFEVTVAAMPAINSHVVVEVARDLVRFEPDLFVVYLGNNEIVGPYGPGTVFSPLSRTRPLIRAGIRLKATRTGQWLAGVLGRLGTDSDTPRVWRGLEMFQDRLVAADDPRLRTAYSHFRENLEDIRATVLRSGAGLILCTVGSNLRDCPPFASLHRADLSETDRATWDTLYGDGVRLEGAGDFPGAIGRYLAAAEIDDRHADLQFRLGYCYESTDAHEQARERFVLARDLDALRFRPDHQINAVIREVATGSKEGRVHLVDTEEVLRRGSPCGLPGRELFHEHVHMTFEGNYLVAKAVCEQVLPAGEFALGDAATCAERLAYNAWAHYNTLFKVLNYYIRKPPFTSQLYHERHVARLEQEIARLEARLTTEACQQIGDEYRRLIERSPSDMWLRLQFAEFASTRLKDEKIAIEQCRQVQALAPHSYKPHLILALPLGNLNRLDEAIEHLEAAVRLKPTAAQAHYLLGLSYQARGRLDEAMTSYAQAVRLRPDNADACERMYHILMSRGQAEQARRLRSRIGLPKPPDDNQ